MRQAENAPGSNTTAECKYVYKSILIKKINFHTEGIPAHRTATPLMNRAPPACCRTPLPGTPMASPGQQAPFDPMALMSAGLHAALRMHSGSWCWRSSAPRPGWPGSPGRGAPPDATAGRRTGVLPRPPCLAWLAAVPPEDDIGPPCRPAASAARHSLKRGLETRISGATPETKTPRAGLPRGALLTTESQPTRQPPPTRRAWPSSWPVFPPP